MRRAVLLLLLVSALAVGAVAGATAHRYRHRLRGASASVVRPDDLNAAWTAYDTGGPDALAQHLSRATIEVPRSRRLRDERDFLLAVAGGGLGTLMPTTPAVEARRQLHQLKHDSAPAAVRALFEVQFADSWILGTRAWKSGGVP